MHSHFTVTEEADAQIQLAMTQARHEIDGDEEGQQLAFYGSKLNLGDTIIAARGMLERIEDGDQPNFWTYITYSIADDDLPPPPDGLKPISIFWEMVAGLFGYISIQYVAEFSYNTEEGAESSVSIPTPLMLPDQSSVHGLTHIESVTLSRRENGELTHTVAIELSEVTESIDHTVTFAASSNFSQVNMKRAFDIMHEISAALIIQDRGESDGGNSINLD